MPSKNAKGEIVFADFPDFRPNLTPKEIFHLGSFGGTYWRPIWSSVTRESYKDLHLEYPASWWRGLSDDKLVRDWKEYDKSQNRYGVKVGTTLQFWELKDWIHPSHPYGWVHWYCDFYTGKRGEDDARQVQRWVQTAGPRSRFRRALVNQILKKKAAYDDESVSPKIRQTLQHWAVQLTAQDL